MGCDIHGYVEIKQDGKWHIQEPIYGMRNYAIFAKLFGVRNHFDYEPLAQDRGLPEDTAEDIKFWAGDYGLDGHSHSYITAKELEQIGWKETKQSPYIYYSKVHDDGTETEFGGFMASTGIDAVTSENLKKKGEAIQNDYHGAGKHRFYKKNLSFQDEVNDSKWEQQIRDIIEQLNYYEDARMVVWFDN